MQVSQAVATRRSIRAFEDRPVDLAVLRRVEGRGVVETAHRALENCGQVFRYAVATGRIVSDPARDLKDALRRPMVKHFPAITSPERSPRFPDIPTMAELGLPSVSINVWHALYAPKGTPPEALAKLHAALQDALNDKTVQERFDQLGTLLFPTAERSREAHGKKLADELVRLRGIVQAAGLEAQSN